MVEKLQQYAEKNSVSLLPAKSFMTSEVVTLGPQTTIAEAIQIFVSSKISGAPVVNATGNLLGIISEHDLLLQAASKDLEEPIGYVKNVLTIHTGTTLKEVLVLFYKNHMRRLPVVDVMGKIQGMVSRIDVLQKLVNVKEG
jgi:CBS domain-containing protein